jgi:hypothetical protein
LFDANTFGLSLCLFFELARWQVLVLMYLAVTMPPKKEELSDAEKGRRKELASLREKGLGDVAQRQSQFEAFEFTNNPLRPESSGVANMSQPNLNQDLTGGVGGDSASGYLDVHDGESQANPGLPAGMTNSDVWMEI